MYLNIIDGKCIPKLICDSSNIHLEPLSQSTFDTCLGANDVCVGIRTKSRLSERIVESREGPKKRKALDSSQ